MGMTIDNTNSNQAIQNRVIDMVESVAAKHKDHTQRQQAEQEYSKEQKKQLEAELRVLSKRLNEEMRSLGTSITFSYNDVLGGLTVTVKEFGSGRVIRQIPDREAIELMHKMREAVGIIFDKQA